MSSPKVKRAPRPPWDGGPEAAVELAHSSAKRRERATFNVVWRELIGAGARPAKPEKGSWWSITNLPLGGRLKVTGSKDSDYVATLWREVREGRERRHWGALVQPGWGRSQGPTVVMPLEEFASLVGELDRLKREEARRAEHEHLERDGRGGAGAEVHPQR